MSNSLTVMGKLCIENRTYKKIAVSQIINKCTISTDHNKPLNSQSTLTFCSATLLLKLLASGPEKKKKHNFLISVMSHDHILKANKPIEMTKK